MSENLNLNLFDETVPNIELDKEEEVALPGKKSEIDADENPPKSIGEIFSAPGTDFDDLKEALEINKEDESEISDEFSDKED